MQFVFALAALAVVCADNNVPPPDAVIEFTFRGVKETVFAQDSSFGAVLVGRQFLSLTLSPSTLRSPPLLLLFSCLVFVLVDQRLASVRKAVVACCSCHPRSVCAPHSRTRRRTLRLCTSLHPPLCTRVSRRRRCPPRAGPLPCLSCAARLIPHSATAHLEGRRPTHSQRARPPSLLLIHWRGCTRRRPRARRACR